jgi:hypothetical protein
MKAHWQVPDSRPLADFAPTIILKANPGRCPSLVCAAPLELISLAPTGRNIPAQGIALGHRPPTPFSPEGAAHSSPRA